MLRALREKIQGLGTAVWRAHASPGRLAAAVFIGAIVGASPLIGFHLPLCLLLAALLRLNTVAMYAAANISLPFFLPALAFACVQCGAWLRHGQFLSVSRNYFSATPVRALAGEFFLDWLLGGVVVGSAIGALFAIVIWLVARRRVPSPQDAQRALAQSALMRAAARYGGVHNVYNKYIWWKARLDPCYAAIAERVPANSFSVDLGSGPGLLALTLHELGEGRTVLAVERDPRKTAVARRAADDAPVKFIDADVLEWEIPACDAVCLVDILHYFSPAQQTGLIERCASALRPGGRLFIREMDAASGRGVISKLFERIALKTGFTRADRVAPLAVADYRAALESAGLAVTVEPFSGPLHPGNVLIEGVKQIGVEGRG